jgi:hypothetical protein
MYASNVLYDDSGSDLRFFNSISAARAMIASSRFVSGTFFFLTSSVADGINESRSACSAIAILRYSPIRSISVRYLSL